MSLVDRTNETIPLSLHELATVTPAVAQIEVDADSDSSCDPSAWVYIDITDNEHDADSIRLTYHEATLLHDRLGRILGTIKPPKIRYRNLHRASQKCSVGDLVRSVYNDSGAVWRVETMSEPFKGEVDVRSITSGRTSTRHLSEMNVVEEVAF